MYHFSMFHASHHITPVPASEKEVLIFLVLIHRFCSFILLFYFIACSKHLDSQIEAEALAVKEVSKSICPMHIVLDKVVLTSTGVLLGCWQVCFFMFSSMTISSLR